MLRFALIALAVAAGAAAPAAQTASDRDRERLGRQLANYRADGPPVDCITPARTNSSGGNYGDSILIRGQDDRLYLNRLGNACRVRETDAVISQRPGLRICRGEFFLAQDLYSGVGGGCSYGAFEPYRRIPRR